MGLEVGVSSSVSSSSSSIIFWLWLLKACGSRVGRGPSPTFKMVVVGGRYLEVMDLFLGGYFEEGGLLVELN